MGLKQGELLSSLFIIFFGNGMREHLQIDNVDTFSLDDIQIFLVICVRYSFKSKRLLGDLNIGLHSLRTGTNSSNSPTTSFNLETKLSLTLV